MKGRRRERRKKEDSVKGRRNKGRGREDKRSRGMGEKQGETRETIQE